MIRSTVYMVKAEQSQKKPGACFIFNNSGNSFPIFLIQWNKTILSHQYFILNKNTYSLT